MQGSKTRWGCTCGGLTQLLEQYKCLWPGFLHVLLPLGGYVLIDHHPGAFRQGEQRVVLVRRRPGPDGFACGVFDPVGNEADVTNGDEWAVTECASSLARCPERGDMRSK